MKTKPTSPRRKLNEAGWRGSSLFQLPAGLSVTVRKQLDSLLDGLPPLEGRPVRVSFRPGLRLYHRGLVSGASKGREVHAGSNLPQRRMVFDESLLGNHAELVRIFIHEVFHFAWRRLSNNARLAYETLISGELGRGARGELGWSSEWKKQQLKPPDRALRARRWREYICESFCDSAAWLYSGAGEHEEFTLRGRFRRARANWFRDFLPGDEHLRI